MEELSKKELLQQLENLGFGEWEKKEEIYKKLIDFGEYRFYPELINIYCFSNRKDEAIELFQKAKNLGDEEINYSLTDLENRYFLYARTRSDGVTNFDADDIIKKIKDTYQKKAQEIIITGANPGIRDSKLGGIPFLPIGEDIPRDSVDDEMFLLMQVNLDKTNYGDYLTTGILEIFINKKFDETVVRYYEDSSVDYQSNIEISSNPIVLNPLKIDFKPTIADLPTSNYKFELFLTEQCHIYSVSGWSAILDNYHVEDYFGVMNGYAQFIASQDPRRYYSRCRRYDECILSLNSSIDYKNLQFGDGGIINIVISHDDLVNKKFDDVGIYCDFS